MRISRPLCKATCALLFFSQALTACSPKGRPLTELSPKNSAEQYVVKEGDTLTVQVWGEQKLSGEVFVREDGNFTMPLIEDVKAAGFAPKQIAQDVTTRLKKYVPAATVSVSVSQTAPIRYFLSGQFIKPGEYRSDKKITFLQAVATGGDFAPFADKSALTLIRRDNLTEKRYVLDYNLVVEGKQPNPELLNGDIIVAK